MKDMKLVSIHGKYIINASLSYIHSFISRDHKELTTVSNDMIISELKWTELAIQEVIGVAPRLMRPVRIRIISLYHFNSLIIASW